MPSRRGKGGCLAIGAVLLAACTSTASPPPTTAAHTPSPSPVRTAPSLPAGPSTVQTRPSLPATPTPEREQQFDVAAALRTVRVLAEDIGPREATTPAYRRAASYVEGRLRAYGYQVRQQPFRVPAGVSWGIRVPAGRSHNVIATPNGFDAARPHLIVGAHLDTVPQAPGAEDNASGVAVLLELARLAAAPTTQTTQPVVFVAFGAEEPRGPADDEHHFGSLHYVGRMSAEQRRALTGMISLDRVGVGPSAGPSVRVCTGGRSPTALARAIRAAAARVEVPTRACENRTSDHWPFEKAGETVARLGGHPYAAYHSARDRTGVVQPSQLARTGRVMWEFLSAD